MVKVPRVVEGGAMRVAGTSAEYTRETTGEIIGQWMRFNAELPSLEVVRLPEETYGVIYPLAKMRYVCAVERVGDWPLPAGWVEVEVPAQRYAVFADTGGVARIRELWPAIYGEWLPGSGMETTDGPMLEKYPGDWVTSGDFEIWVPVK